MKLTSPAFDHNSNIPAKYTCDGANINPPLEIGEIPVDAQSLILIMDDPDVPTSIKPDGMWDHWLVWNIPPLTSEVAENTNPAGTIGRNSRGEYKYGGPCPPDRQHRYFFKLFALDTLLNIPKDASKQDLQKAMVNHIIEQALGGFCA